MNQFNLILPNGTKRPFEYVTTSSIFMILNLNAITSMEDMQKVKIEIPTDLPKSRYTEVKNAVGAFKIPIVISDKLSWEKLGIGKQTDFSDPNEVANWLIDRGANPKNAEHTEAILAVKGIADKFISKWNELKKAKIVSEDAGVYYKTIEANRKSKKS